MLLPEIKWGQRTACHERWLPLDALPPEACFVYRCTNNMTMTEVGSCCLYASAFVSDLQSQDVIVIGNDTTHEYLLVGAVTAFRSLTYFLLHREGRFTGLLMRQPHIKPGEEPEKTVILQGSDWRQLLLQYSRMAAQAMGVKPIPPARNLTGYCTWYYYYADVTEKDFLENAAILKQKVGSSYSPDVVQIDDGYQSFQGDWLDQDASWPTPLNQIAGELQQAGITPGIWIMPFLASTASRTFREHQDWFVKNTDGAPLVFTGWSPAPDNHWACLDATISSVRDHITCFMKGLWDKGFRYFKMDGLGFGLPDGVFSDPGATPVSAFRLGMKTIREAVPEAILLGCCPPFMACLGYIDLCRISADTSRSWIDIVPNTEEPPNADQACVGILTALRGTISNWWKNDIWFRSDPDVIMARSDNAYYTLGEARLSAAMGILTGISLTSDHLGKITPERMHLLECAARYRLRDALPEKWLPYNWPYAFSGTVDGMPALLLLNISEHPKTYHFKDYGLTGSCSEKLIGLGDIGCTFTLPPHDAALVIKESGK